MTVANTLRKAGPFNCNGVTTSFPFTFKVFAETDLLVVEFDTTTEVETIKALATHYSVSLNGDQDVSPGGSVDAVSPPPTGKRWTLLSAVPALQDTDLVGGGGFYPSTIENALDRGIALIQQLEEEQSRSLLLPASSSADATLPAPAAGRLIGWNAGATALQNYGPSDTAALAAALADASGAGLVNFSYAQNYVASTLGWLVSKAYGINITAAPYLADSTGVDDAGPAIAAAHAAFPGVPLYAPRGTYRIATKPNIKTSTFSGAFGPGFKLFGDGQGVTVFETAVANDAMFDLDTDVDHATTFKGALGAMLRGFTVKNTAAVAGATAIKLTACYAPVVEDVHIDGMTAHGIWLPTVYGDNDGSNQVNLARLRIENCQGWGIKADGDSGFNELSFMYMRHVFVQTCGVTNGAYQPPSGGMIWKGQVLKMEQCAFAVNVNCALFIPGQAGAAQIVSIDGTAFENNTGRNIFCRGVSAFKARNIQQYHNNSHIGTVGIEFEASSFTVRNIDIDGVVVRATSGNNAFTAFKISGSNADLSSCRVRNVTWDNFDYAGQARFDGWLFDSIAPSFQFVLDTNTSLIVRRHIGIGGNTVPLRLRGGIGGTPSTTGEWVPYRLGAAGLAITNSGLAANTRYYCYVFDDASVSGGPKLELSTTAPTTDATSGYRVKTGDATRTYVCSVETDAGGLFKMTAGGWLNPLRVPGAQVGVDSFVWADNTGALRRIYATEPTGDTAGSLV